jgi:hypothetical protein
VVATEDLFERAFITVGGRIDEVADSTTSFRFHIVESVRLCYFL